MSTKCSVHVCVCAGLRARCVAELNEVLEEVETHSRLLSEELLEQLALRDELTFHKEASNTFISALIDLQTLHKEQQRRRRLHWFVRHLRMHRENLG